MEQRTQLQSSPSFKVEAPPPRAMTEPRIQIGKPKLCFPSLSSFELIGRALTIDASGVAFSGRRTSPQDAPRRKLLMQGVFDGFSVSAILSAAL
jgi:hypothetical protein